MVFKIISIDGNIGSGKSTILSYLKHVYSTNDEIIFLKEPVDEWQNICDENNIPILQLFYANQERYAFAFQIMAYISRLKILRNTIKTLNPDQNYIIITERCLFTDRYVFAEMLKNQQKIEYVCYQIYQQWFDEFVLDLPISHIIYINTTPIKCYERIHKRSRSGEELIPINYLNECNEQHNKYLSIMETNNIPHTKLDFDENLNVDENNIICFNDDNNLIQYNINILIEMINNYKEQQNREWQNLVTNR